LENIENLEELHFEYDIPFRELLLFHKVFYKNVKFYIGGNKLERKNIINLDDIRERFGNMMKKVMYDKKVLYEFADYLRNL